MSAVNVEVKSLENAEVEIKAEIPAEEFEQYRDQVVRRLSVNIEMPGFRKGNVPEKILVQKIGEMPILEEMAETAISHAYPKILMEHKIDAIGRPEVNITKIAKGSSLGFSIKTAVMPEVKLSDYKAAAREEMAKKEEIKLEEKEMEEAIADIRKQRAHVITGNEQEEAHNPVNAPKEEGDESKKPALPELNDEFVKTLGDFKGVEDFKAKLHENMLKEKETKAAQKKRMVIIEKVIAGSDIALPAVIVESELDKMMAQFQGDIARMGLKFDEYLKYIKKTKDDLRKEWLPDARARAKAQLILHKIATEEKITVPEEEIEKEVKKLVEYYKDASPERARDYVATVLTNEAVFKFLEKEGSA
ncbi:MAG: trigger factor [Patescibacteria group bacterium]